MSSSFLDLLQPKTCQNLDDLDSFLPLPGVDGSIQSLQRSSGFDVVVDGRVQLLAVRQVVAPLLLQVDQLTRESAPGEIDRARVRVTLPEAFQGLEQSPRG